MADGQVTVVARFKARSGMEERLRETTTGILVEGSRADAGCLNFDLHQGSDDPSLFVLYENWTSKQDLEDHWEQPHVKAWYEKYEVLAEGEVEILLLEMVSEPDSGTAGR